MFKHLLNSPLLHLCLILSAVWGYSAPTHAWEPLDPNAAVDEVPRTQSPLQVILDSDVQDGLIYVPANATDVKQLIRQQLRYTLGQLQWFNSITQFSWFEIQMGSSQPVGNGLLEVRYQLKVRISWDRHESIPNLLELVLPARGDDQGLNGFFNTYASRCNGKGTVDIEEFFYYFYPLQKGCPLASKLPSESGRAVRLHFKLKVSQTNTTNKYPEYRKIWEDGQLIVTLIYSKNIPASSANNDAGIYEYNRTYSSLFSTYGNPTYINDRFSGVPGVRHPTLEMHFNTSAGPLIVHMRLESTISGAGQDFVDWYHARTPDSDLVIYNGHSGLGMNIDRLGSLGKFKPGKYQIYFVDGCGTFAYFGEELYKTHGAVNPGFAPSKHLDVMTNTLSSYFNEETKSSMLMIRAMLRHQDSYLQILQQIDPKQRVVVDGEEDND